MYQQHYNKFFKQTGEFDEDASAIIFPQIIKFMWEKKYIQGKLLDQIITNSIFDRKEVEEIAKLKINCEELLKYFNEYKLKAQMEGTIVDDKKIILSLEHKVEITLNLAERL